MPLQGSTQQAVSEHPARPGQCHYQEWCPRRDQQAGYRNNQRPKDAGSASLKGHPT